MAKFELQDIKIMTVPAGKINAGEKYIIADATNTNCVWERGQRFTSFMKTVITMLTPLLSIDNGGSAQMDQTIPDHIKYIHGRFDTYYPACDFYKRHLTDDQQGRWKAGDYVKASNGTPLVYPAKAGIVVFVQYYMDEHGKEQPVRGMSLSEQGMRAFQAYCEPIVTASEATTPIVPAPNSVTPQGQQPPIPGAAPVGTQMNGINPQTGQPNYQQPPVQ